MCGFPIHAIIILKHFQPQGNTTIAIMGKKEELEEDDLRELGAMLSNISYIIVTFKTFFYLKSPVFIPYLSYASCPAMGQRPLAINPAHIHSGQANSADTLPLSTPPPDYQRRGTNRTSRSIRLSISLADCCSRSCSYIHRIYYQDRRH